MMILLYSLLLTTAAVGGGYLVGEWLFGNIDKGEN